MEPSKGKNGILEAVQRLGMQLASSQPEKALLYLKKAVMLEPDNPQAYERLAALQKKQQYYNQAIATAEAGLKAFEQKRKEDPRTKASLLFIAKHSKLESSAYGITVDEFKDLCNELAALVGPSDEITKTAEQIVKTFPGVTNKDVFFH